MNRYLLVGTALALSGCAHQMIFDKLGGTQAQFSRDLGECKLAGLYAPQRQAPQLAPNYVANTTYFGNSATTTVQEQPNEYQGLADLGTAIGNKVRQKRTTEYCMEAKGYVLRANS